MSIDIKLHKNDLPDDLDLGNVIAVDGEFMGLNVRRDPLCLIQVSSGNSDAHIIQLDRSKYRAPNLSKKLSSLGDVFVNDAFGTAHRAHASTSIIASFFPKNKFAGELLLKEVESIHKVMNTGKKPVLGILGGAKVSSKITIINNIMDKVDKLIIGGGMAFTFIKAQGGHIGDSICDDDRTSLALSILEKATSGAGDDHRLFKRGSGKESCGTCDTLACIIFSSVEWVDSYAYSELIKGAEYYE